MAYKDKEKQRAYQRAWIKRNALWRANQAERMKTFKRKNKEYIRTLKEENPCTDCGGYFPYFVMQFDHIGTDKKDNINNMMQHSMEALKAEVAKCELVCANCHAFRTHERYTAAKEDEGVLSPKVSVRLASAVPNMGM